MRRKNLRDPDFGRSRGSWGPGRAKTVVKSALEKALPAALSLHKRERIARWIGRRKIPGHHWFPTRILRDWQLERPDDFHRFLWTNHLGDAEGFEVERRFGGSINLSRQLLFSDLCDHLARERVDRSDVKAVLEVGCSVGHLLRHLETEIFPHAEILDGFDIDADAVEQGRAHLESMGSKVRLSQLDMVDLAEAIAGSTYDVVLCAGTLMYLAEPAAASAVHTMLRHSKVVLVLSDLAYPGVDNSTLSTSMIRPGDGVFWHNLDVMVRRAGGTVRFRRWESRREGARKESYFVFAER